MIKNTIFISHAVTPADDTFTRWLALRLMAAGYKVWCDLLKLKKGGDFWREIETEIRQNTCKFLLVLSEKSNSAPGVLKEIAVASKAQKVINDDTFICPLKVDPNLSYDDINVDIIRLNAIDFTASWATGLKALLKSLEEQKIPRSPENYSKVAQLIHDLLNIESNVIWKTELYDSNWFPITTLPKELFFFKLKGNFDSSFKKDISIPATTHQGYLVTFECFESLPSDLSEKVDQNPKILLTQEILDQNITVLFIDKKQAKLLLIEILNKAFGYTLKQTAGIRSYLMSGHYAFWLPADVIPKNKIGRIQLVGKQKDKMWHFAISASVKLFPEPLLQIRSHIVFTTDGQTLIREDGIQHSARRTKGKSWWNKDWRNRLFAFVTFLSKDTDCMTFSLGNEKKFLISATSIQFQSPISYKLPKNNNLDDEFIETDIEKQGDSLMNTNTESADA
ncbi:TIR domain-containing protein [Victivallis lenta]|uniref:TIR domain-containing protein n=1 Tax=Victivallis lenta TaxID=2606640 RepID=UPI0012B397A8